MPRLKPGQERKRVVLSATDRKAAYHMVLAMSEDGKPVASAMTIVAAQFGVHRSTISRLWDRVGKNKAAALNNQNDEPDDQNNNNNDVYRNNLHLCKKGKYKHDREALKEQVKALPFNQRRKFRHLAGAIGIPLSTVHYLTRETKLFKRVSSAVKPTLNATQKHLRVLHALEKINPATINTRGPMVFNDMMDEIHIDEKWFFLCKATQTYILVSDEEEPPERYVRHKSHIEKVMFLCAQARPRKVDRVLWDGKIGIWPVGAVVHAQRSSVNRPAGTPEWENDNVDKDTYRNMLISHVLPSIVANWPAADFNNPNITITIQQDGAKSHIKPDDEIWLQALHDLGLYGKIRLITQPSNSPDTNLNDLGFFNALQSKYYNTAPTNSLQLIAMVEKTFREFPASTINKIWLTLQSCLNEIIDHVGANDYKIPHMGKDKLEREGALPRALTVTDNARYYLE